MITLVRNTINNQDIDELIEWLKTYPRLTKGDLTVELEEKWASWLGTNHSILEIAHMISDDIAYLPRRPGEARETLANIEKIKTFLGCPPSVRLEDWLKAQL